jgi:hypothetical protein
MGLVSRNKLKTTSATACSVEMGWVQPLLAVLLLLVSATSEAGYRDQAKRIHDRLAGIPPSALVLDDMEIDVANGDGELAAYTAMQNSAFYNVTLKNFATPWTNRDQSIFAPLNDYSATVIGMIRDDVAFNTLLSANLVYVGSGNGIPAYSPTNNDHYQALEDNAVDLQTDLNSTPQSDVSGIPANATAGVMTTRAAAEAFFVAGTNRAMFRFTLLNHLCTDLEQLKDTTRPPDRIRQDVSRSPGGDSRLFNNNCVGCHSGMDPMAQAFAYYNFDEGSQRVVYTANQVQPKYHINGDNFPYGFITPDDSWNNYWRSGPNSNLGWNGTYPAQRNGAKSMGSEMANSEAFAKCQVKKVFRNVCLRDPADGGDETKLNQMLTSFKNNGYKMKQVFAEAADYCKGD